MFASPRRPRRRFRRSFWALALCAFGLAGCHFKFKHAARAQVTLHGHQSGTERMIIARRVAVALWDHGALKKRIADHFPDLTPADLNGLYMKADDQRVREGGTAIQVVRVLIFFQYTKKISDPQRVADYCKTLLEKQLARDPQYKP